MNPFKNISIFRDQICNCLPWRDTDTNLEITPFPEKEEYIKQGSTDYYESQLKEIILEKKEKELLQQENDRLQHLTTVLIDHIWKKQPFPLKEIDQQMALFDKEQMDERSQQNQFDDGGIDGTPRNA